MGGLLLAEKLKIATVALASYPLLDLLTEKDDERLAAVRKPHAGGFRNWKLIRNRLDSLFLSAPFVRLNQVRRYCSARKALHIDPKKRTDSFRDLSFLSMPSFEKHLDYSQYEIRQTVLMLLLQLLSTHRHSLNITETYRTISISLARCFHGVFPVTIR